MIRLNPGIHLARQLPHHLGVCRLLLHLSQLEGRVPTLVEHPRQWHDRAHTLALDPNRQSSSDILIAHRHNIA